VSDFNKEKGGVEAVDRALSILLAFNRSDRALTLTSLCVRTGLHKTTAQRLLSSLERADMVWRLPDKRYRLGPGIVRLGRVFGAMTGLPDAARGPVEALMRKTNLSVSVYVRRGDLRVCVHRADPPDLPLDAVRVGDARPLDETATGLAFRRYGDTVAGQTPVEAIFTLGIYNPGMASMACPIYGADDGLAGVLTVSASVTRLSPQTAQAIQADMEKAATDIERAIGRALPQTAS
jgi:DNA-binding IclR family transcriptional regulator